MFIETSAKAGYNVKQVLTHLLIKSKEIERLKPFDKTLGSLSTHVFETRMATGREHFEHEDCGVSLIFILIISNGEKILSNANVSV